MGFADRARAVYTVFNSAVTRAHCWSGGLSTRLLPRALAFGAGLAVGAVTIDSIVDLLTGEHVWMASAAGTPPQNYTSVSEHNNTETCQRIFIYRNETGGFVGTTSENMPNCNTNTNGAADNAWQRAAIAAGLVLAGLGLYGAHRWHKWTQRGLRTARRQKVGEVEVPTYDALETAIRGLRNSAEAGMNPEEVTALRRRLGDTLDATYAARGGFDTHQTLREQLGQIGR